MLKRTFAVLLTALLVVGMAGCGLYSPKAPKIEDFEGMYLSYSDPEGYEVLSSSESANEYAKFDDNNEITYLFGVAFTEASQELANALYGKSVSDVEDELWMDFDDNVTVTFLTIGDCRGIRLDFHDEPGGELVDITYIMSVGKWQVRVLTNSGYDNRPYLEELDSDMVALIESIEIETFEFSN